MRSLILSLVLAAGALALTPSQADATWNRRNYGGYYPSYYGGYNYGYGGYRSSYYYPTYSYAAPGYSSFYASGYQPYMPAYTYYGGPVGGYYTAPRVVYYPYRGW